MYLFVLSVHNILRWLVIITAILALVRAYRGWSGKMEWLKMDDRAGILFTSMVDMQLLVGLILYLFISPITTGAFANLSIAATDRVTAYFTFEHGFAMVAAMALAHIGRAIAKKATIAQAKFRTAAIWFSFSVLVILIAIPWPFLAEEIGRPLLRLFS
jgi:hypothetical protein